MSTSNLNKSRLHDNVTPFLGQFSLTELKLKSITHVSNKISQHTVLKQTKNISYMNSNSYSRIERMGGVDEIVADSDSEHDEILDAAMYKTDETYPSNLSKDRKRAIRKKAERLEGELFFLRKNGK